MNDRPDTGHIEVSGKTSLKMAQAQTAPVPAATPEAAPEAAPQPGEISGPFPAPTPETNYAQSKPAAAFPVENPKSIDPAAVKLTITAEQGKPVVLPADTQIAAILVSGDDIIIRETDGDLIVIKGGLKAVPALQVAGIEIPASALVASLQAGGVTLPAAGGADGANGNAQSSGGNFAHGPGEIGDPFHIRDLLGFGELNRSTEKKELAEGFVKKVAEDFRPEIVSAANVRVDEDGLKGANKDDGNNPLSEQDGGGSNTDTGTIVVDFGGASDVPNNLLNAFAFNIANIAGLSSQLNGLDGQDVTFSLQAGGQTLVGKDSNNNEIIRIDITGAAIGADGHTVTYTYEVILSGPIQHPVNSEEDIVTLQNVGFTVTDKDGDPASGTVNVAIYDDVIERVVLRFDDESSPGPLVHGDVKEDGLSTNAGDASDGIGGGDDEVSGGVGSLDLLFRVGADSPLSFSLSTSTSGLPALLSNGLPVTYSVLGNVLTASAGGHAVFTLTVNANGSWTFDLMDQLDHVPGSGDAGTTLQLVGGGTLSGGIDFSSIISASDADGDTIVGAAPGAFVITVENDVPEFASEGGVNATVTEDSLGHGATGGTDLSLGNSDDADDTAGTADETKITFAAIAGYLLPGADEDLVFGLVKQISGPVTIAGSNTAVTSKGEAVLWGNDSETVVAYVDVGGTPGFDAGDRVIFTVSVGVDGYLIDLKDQIDHQNDVDNPDDYTLNLNLAPIFTAEDADGDAVDFSNANITLTVENDIPILTAHDAGQLPTDETTVIEYGIRAGNVADRGVFGPDTAVGPDFDILLTGFKANGSQDSVNTNNTQIGVGQAQDFSDGEKLLIEFKEDLNIIGQPNNPQISYGPSYDVSTFSFEMSFVKGSASNTSVVFVSAIDNGTAVGFTLYLNDVAQAPLPVYQGGVVVGYVLGGIHESDELRVDATGNSKFDQVIIQNYNNVLFDSDNNGSLESKLTNGSDFKISGLSSEIITTTYTTETFKVGHDESSGVNTDADPNAADDTSANPPDNIEQSGAIGYAVSGGSVLGLFTSSIGADEEGTFSFKITDKNGDPIDDVDSGLETLDGTDIILSTTPDGTIVGMAGDDKVFAITIDADGKVWVAQYLPISHPVEGFSAAAHDDIVTVVGQTLFVEATLTDADGDTASVVSPVALEIQFQDSGPKAFDNVNTVGEGGAVTGNVLTDGTTDIFGTDGPATGTGGGVIGGTFTSDLGTLVLSTTGAYTYTSLPNTISSAKVDTFTYTIVDGDGDKSTATLEITINPSNFTGLDEDGLLVNEKGLASGSTPLDGSQIDNLNSLSDNFTGGTGPFIYEITSTPLYGVVALQSNGNYSYTLTTTYDGATSNNQITTENNVDHFTFKITDNLGNIATGTAYVDIIDDVPTATPEAPVSVVEGSSVNGQFDFIKGADGATVTAINGTALVFTDGLSQAISMFGGTLVVTPTGAYTFTAPSDDVYKDASTITGSFTITDGDGDKSTAGFQFGVTDDSDVVTVDLTVEATESEGANVITYTASLSDGHVANNDITVTLANGETITIVAGQNSGTVDTPTQGDDVYLDGATVTNSITNAVEDNAGTPGALESLQFNPATVSTAVADTTDPVTATLSAGSPVYDSTGVNITYTVALTGVPGSVAALSGGDGALTFNLANGGPIVFNAGETSHSITVHYSFGSFGSAITNQINSVSGQGEYEQLVPTGTTSINVNTAPSASGSISLVVNEAALDLVAEGDLRAGVVTGSTPSATTETAQASGGMTFTPSAAEAITVAFAIPTGGNIPVVSGLAAGYTMNWAINGSGQLEGSLISPTSMNLGVAIVLALSGNTSASAGGAAIAPTVTTTLVDNLIHASGSGNVTITSIQVRATDSSGDFVQRPVDVTVSDDVPTAAIADAPNSVNENATLNGTWSLTPGADGVTSLAVTVGAETKMLSLALSSNTTSFVLAAGTLTVKADGTYTFAAGSVSTNQSVTFSILATDGDGDTSSDTQTITINNVNSAPVVTAKTDAISEEGLNGGNPDTTGSPDTTNLSSKSGTVVASDPDSDALTFTFGTPSTALTQNGVAIVWSGGGTGTLLGTVGGVTVVKAVIGAGGAYTVSVHGGVDQSGAGEGSIDLVLPVNVSDGQLTTASTLTVSIEDDSPVLGTFTSSTIPNEIGTVGGTFVMTGGADGVDHFNITGPTITGLTYSAPVIAADGTTSIFGQSGTTNIFSLTVRPDGTYTYALITPMAGTTQNYAVDGLPAGGPNWRQTTDGVIEFSSPGGINSNNNGFGVANAFTGKTESFTMEFHTAGSDLGNIDNLPSSNPAYYDAVSLNVKQINGSGGTYTWTATNTSTGATQVGAFTITSSTTSVLIDPTISFNTLTVLGNNDVDGQGVSFSSVNVTKNILPQDQNLAFSIVAVDNDGDSSSAQTLNIHQVAGDGAGNFALTGFTGTVNDWIAGSMHADTISGGSGVDMADYTGSVGAISINLTDSGNAGTLVGGSLSNPLDGQVFASGDASGDSLSSIEGLVGGSGNDYLFGNSSANYLAGGIGNDTLNGEGGNDTLVGGAGADTITTGTGSDTVYYDSSALGSLDTITDFVTGQDVIDLTDLFTVDTAGGQTLANYAHMNGNVLEVDVNGANVGGQVWTTIATVTGHVAGQVNILFDDNTHNTDQNGLV